MFGAELNIVKRFNFAEGNDLDNIVPSGNILSERKFH